MDKQESKYDILASKYPELVGKSRFGGFCVGEGWFNIIDRLCGMIYHQVKQHNEDVEYRLAHVKRDPEASYSEDLITKWDMPAIRQVKEKFGTLRFYMDTNLKQFRHYVEFAEAMSGVTCEECGNPGTYRNDTGWIHVMCDEHEAEYLERLRIQNEQYGKDEPVELPADLQQPAAYPHEEYVWTFKNSGC